MTVLPEAGASDALYVVDLAGLTDPFFHSPFPSGAGRAFLERMQLLIATRRPAFMAIAADTPWPTFRDEIAPKKDYKAGRVRSGAERAAVLEQRRIAEELSEDVLGVRVFRVRGFEADDILATLTRIGLEEGLRVVVVAVDKDMMQLVRADLVTMWDGKGAPVGPAEVRERFGVDPHQMADYLAIAGDRGDNVAGIAGIGKVGAARLLSTFASVEDAVEAAERDGGDKHPLFATYPQLWSKLLGSREHARIAKELTTLRANVPLSLRAIDDLQVRFL